MSLFRKIWKYPAVLLIVLLTFGGPAAEYALAKEPVAADSDKSVELNGDNVDFVMSENKFVASGNVVITHGDQIMTCDKVEFYREAKKAIAEGHVVLKLKTGTIFGEKMIYNFGDGTGEFMGARIFADPYYGTGKTIEKIGENHMVMNNAQMTTCDLDKPHFHMTSRKIDVITGEKITARGVTMVVGKLPILYIPKFSQHLRDKRPFYTFTPGYSKDWGAFLLQKLHFYFNENVKATLSLDYRERRGLAEGGDLSYKTAKWGEGIVRLYYTLDRPLTAHHIWQTQPTPPPETERFRSEWRHKWTIDDKTDMILQYYKLSDPIILKDYFKSEFNNDPEPPSYFLLSRALPYGNVSFRADARVNHFVGAVERLPEIKYELSSQKIGSTPFYLRTEDTISNLAKKFPSPTEVRQKTVRLDSDNEISYPFKLSFIELRPFVGERGTYYSRTIDPAQYSVLRGIFHTGSDLSTKFYKVYDWRGRMWGVDIQRLRHIVTPSITYTYVHDPTISSSLLDQFDAVDQITRSHNINLSLENTWQGKVNGQSVDLLRIIGSTDFHLKEDTGSGGFSHVRSLIEYKPVNWMTFSSDTDYDAYEKKLVSADFDFYLNNKDDKWYLSLGKRFNFTVDDQWTTEFGYKFNPKWKASVYERFDTEHGNNKETDFVITRDLHEWEMELSYNQKSGEGTEIMMLFRLKAFPDLGMFNFGTSFNRRKTGSQSSVGL